MKLRLFLTWMLTLVVIAAFSQVSADYDKSVDFSKYKTYSFAGWQKNSDQIINQIDKKRILEAFENELTARGMKYVESGGDAILTLYITTEDKTNTTAYTDYNGGMGLAGRWGYAGGWGGSSTTTVSTSDYTVGTFVVDMYDGTSKDLVWQGILKSTIKENAAKREKSIPKNVSKLMGKFPVDEVK